MKHPLPRLAALLPLLGSPTLFGAILLTGCSESIEQNPAFKEQTQRIERMDEEVQALSRHVDDMGVGLGNLQKQARETASAPGADQARLTTIETRLQGLQQKVQAAVEEHAVLKTDAQKNVSTISKNSEPDGEKTGSTGAKRADSTKGHIVAAAAKPPSKPPAAQEETQAKPSGFYYKVQPNDTPEAIARRHGISEQILLTSNRIPQGGRLFPGQSIFIPSGK